MQKFNTDLNSKQKEAIRIDVNSKYHDLNYKYYNKADFFKTKIRIVEYIESIKFKKLYIKLNASSKIPNRKMYRFKIRDYIKLYNLDYLVKIMMSLKLSNSQKNTDIPNVIVCDVNNNSVLDIMLSLYYKIFEIKRKSYLILTNQPKIKNYFNEKNILSNNIFELNILSYDVMILVISFMLTLKFILKNYYIIKYINKIFDITKMQSCHIFFGITISIFVNHIEKKVIEKYYFNTKRAILPGDYFRLSSTLIEKKGISTFTLQHGAIGNHTAFIPPISDTFLGWGKYSLSWFNQNGFNPCFKELPNFRLYGKIEEINIQNKERILLAPSPVGEPYITKLYKIYEKLIYDNPTIEFSLKLHPGISDKHVFGRLSKFSNIEVIEGSRDVYKILKDTKIIIGVYSTIILEGLLFKCIGFILDLPGLVKYFPKEDFNNTNIYIVEDLNSQINLYKHYNDYSNDEAILKWYFGDKEKIDNIIKDIF